MSGVLAALQERQAAASPKRCKVRQLFKILTETDRSDERDELVEALADKDGLEGVVIAGFIRDAYNFEISAEALRRHRRGACSCERPA